MGSAARMKEVAKLVVAEKPTIVVLSAMSGTTNKLLEIAGYLYKHNTEGANAVITELEQTYKKHVSELYEIDKYKEDAWAYLQERFDYLRSFAKGIFTLYEERKVVAQGELMSTHMFYFYLQEQEVKAKLLPALEFMKTDKNNEPDLAFITEHIGEQLTANKGFDVYVTQGFICQNAYGEVDNLKRGGSDYTASLLGAAIKADEIQIWTDIDGMHDNDPRVVENTHAVRQLNFEEAAELAYFGAKILHPTCVQPAKFAGVPVRLKNTMDPAAPGTIINSELQEGRIKAVAAKDNIIAIKIKSTHMLLAYGFMRKVFEIFENFQTSIDMISTSEVGVSISIDSDAHLEEIVSELKKYGIVTVDKNMCIICVVGDLKWSNLGFETLATDALKDIPVRMISYGGSNYNISFLVSMDDKKKALQNLSALLFNNKEK